MPQETLPTCEQIAERAYTLECAYAVWSARGYRQGSDEANWLDAERELHDALVSKRLLEIADTQGGSIESKAFRLQLMALRRSVCL